MKKPKSRPKFIKHGEFLRCTCEGKLRFYSPSSVDEARNAADDFDFVRVLGFGVYDYAISATYAVALYATLAEAQAYDAQPTPEPEPEQVADKAPEVPTTDEGSDPASGD